MPAACRVGDNHECGAVDTGGSPNVFINTRAAHRVSDADSHSGTQDEGSPNVFINNLAQARVGDKNIGEPIPPFHPPNGEATGSPNVFINS